MSDYKTDQKKWRERSKATKVIWQGGTLDMAIRKFKRAMPDYKVRQQYKKSAWDNIEVKGE